MPGSEFGPYRLTTLLGRGGMGEVWRAVDTSQGGRVVALKLLGAWLAGDEDFVHRFRREAELAAGLSAPNIVPIHRYGEIDGRLFMDMAFVEGSDLGTVLASGPMPVPRTMHLLAQVADALDAAHRAGLVHRDVKPSNVLLTGSAEREHVYLIDFGIARAMDATRISRSGVVIGTVDYMAPECFEGQGDERSDIYALGCVLYQMLTGRKPFNADGIVATAFAHHTAPPPKPSALRPDLPLALDGVIATAMAKRPQDRFPTAGALARAAVDATADATVDATTPVPPPVPHTRQLTAVAGPPPTAGGRRRWAWTAAGTTLVGLVVLIALIANGTFAPRSSAAGPPATSPAVTATSAPAATTTPTTSSDGVTTVDQVFGPACGQLPQGDAPGSLTAMGPMPVASAGATNPLLTSLVTAVTAADLADTLNSQPAITVFAPSNSAFDEVRNALGDEKFSALLADKANLTKVLALHVVGTRYDAAGIVAARTLPTIAGGSLTIGGTPDAPTITDPVGNTARVLCGNIPTSNATAFIIDKVLMPASS